MEISTKAYDINDNVLLENFDDILPDLWAYENSAVVRVTCKSTLTTIGNGAFDSCYNLTDIVIPDSVTSIGNNAFLFCYALTSITIPSSVTTIGNNAFQSSGLISIVIPDTVTSFGTSVLSFCNSLTSVTFGNGITSIDGSALSGLSSVHTVILGNSVASIGSFAFASCTSLTSINIPSSVISIGDGAFEATGLISIVIPDTVTSFGNSVLRSCYSLTSVTIGNGITTFSESFSGFNLLHTVILGNSVTSIPSYCFASCTSLTSINIPSSVTSIGDGAFTSSGLTSIVIPNTVTSIGSNLFQSCTSLTSVTIGNGVTSIGGYTFANCSILSSVTINGNVTFIGNAAFSDCSVLTAITIPNTVTDIGVEAFKNCTSLSSINLGTSITSLLTNTFSNCNSLSSLIIPSSLTSFGGYVFNPCPALNYIQCMAMVAPSVGAVTFAGVAATQIHVPIGSTGYGIEYGGLIVFDDIVGPTTTTTTAAPTTTTTAAPTTTTTAGPTTTTRRPRTTTIRPTTTTAAPVPNINIYVAKLSNPLEEWAIETNVNDTVLSVIQQLQNLENPPYYPDRYIDLSLGNIVLDRTLKLSNYGIQADYILNSNYNQPKDTTVSGLDLYDGVSPNGIYTFTSVDPGNNPYWLYTIEDKTFFLGWNIIDAPLGRDIVAYWNLNESASTYRNDSTGNGYTLNEPAAQTVLSVYGVSNDAALFDVANEKYLYNGEIIIIGDYTISAWVKLNEFNSKPQCIWGTGNFMGGTYTTFFAANDPSYEDRPSFFYYDDSLSGGNLMNALSFVPTINTWYHIVTTHSSSLNTTSIYINSTLTDTITGVVNSDWQGFALSNVIFDNDYYNDYYTVDGAIDETGIWNRALTQEDINKLYNNGTNIVSYPFEDGRWVISDWDNYTNILANTQNLTISSANVPWSPPNQFIWQDVGYGVAQVSEDGGGPFYDRFAQWGGLSRFLFLRLYGYI